MNIRITEFLSISNKRGEGFIDFTEDELLIFPILFGIDKMDVDIYAQRDKRDIEYKKRMMEMMDECEPFFSENDFGEIDWNKAKDNYINDKFVRVTCLRKIGFGKLCEKFHKNNPYLFKLLCESELFCDEVRYHSLQTTVDYAVFGDSGIFTRDVFCENNGQFFTPTLNTLTIDIGNLGSKNRSCSMSQIKASIPFFTIYTINSNSYENDCIVSYIVTWKGYFTVKAIYNITHLE